MGEESVANKYYAQMYAKKKSMRESSKAGRFNKSFTDLLNSTGKLECLTPKSDILG
jgi:hypothetical protein